MKRVAQAIVLILIINILWGFAVFGQALPSSNETAEPGDNIRLPGMKGYTSEAAENYLSDHYKDFGLPERSRFRHSSTSVDEMGIRHMRLNQEYLGIPVFGKEVIVDVKGTEVVSMEGMFSPDEYLANAKADDRTGKVNALKLARESLGFIPESIDFMEDNVAKKLASYENAELTWLDRDKKMLLTYKVDMACIRPKAMNQTVFVNATTGEIVYSINNLNTGVPYKGSGKGVLNDTKPLNLYNQNNKYYLMDTTLGDSTGATKTIKTFDFNTLDYDGYIYLMSDNNGTLGETGDNYLNQRAGVDAHYYFNQVYNFYKNTFNRSSYDNKGTNVYTAVHYTEDGSPWLNACWTGNQMGYFLIGDGDNYPGKQKISYELSAGLDVIAHEFTHAVIENNGSGGLVYENQSGAINESIADLFGQIIERKLKGDKDWNVGEDICANYSTELKRSISNPELYGQPASMTQYVDTTGDNGGVHINSGIPSKASYLIACRLGDDKTMQLYYYAVMHKLTRTADFNALRKALIDSANILYPNTDTADIVADAFDQVGITGIKINSITSNLTSPRKVGEKIRWSCSATGMSSLEYSFNMYKGSTVVASSGGYIANNYFDWTPVEAGGDYRMLVSVRNKGSLIVNSKYSSIFTILETIPVISSYTIGDYFPMNDGMVLVSDISKNGIYLVDTIRGLTLKTYLLTEKAQNIAVDEASNIILATQDSSRIAKINKTTGEITYITTIGRPKKLAIGKNNIAYALCEKNYSATLSVIDLSQNMVISENNAGYYMNYLVCDKNSNNIYVADSSSLYRFAYNETTHKLEQTQYVSSVGGNGLDLTISKDGKHLAYCCGGGNGEGYTVYDFDTSDMKKKFGEWDTGAYPESATFGTNSKYIIISNCNEVNIYDVETHVLIKTVNSTNSYNISKVRIAPDEKYIHWFTSDYDKTEFFSKKNPLYSGNVSSLSITCNPAGPQPAKTDIMLTANAAGGMQLYYRFKVYDGNSSTFLNEYSEDNTYIWNPAKPGDYKIYAYVKSKYSVNEYDAYQVIDFKVNSAQPLSIVDLRPSISSPQTAGSKIRWNCTTMGGTNPIFCFSVYKGNVLVFSTNKYTSDNYFDWIPIEKGSDYRIFVSVKEDGSPVSVGKYSDSYSITENSSLLDEYIITDVETISDGNVIIADKLKNSVFILDASHQRMLKCFSFPETPSRLDYDEDSNVLLVTQPLSQKIVKIDLATSQQTVIDVSGVPDDVVYGEAGIAFASINVYPFTRSICVLDLSTSKEISQISVGDQLSFLAYDRVNNNLIGGESGSSASSLYRFSFNETTKLLEQKQYVWDAGGNGQDMVISNNGKHIAFSCGGGNGDAYSIYDYDSTDLTKHSGEWNTGAYPTSAAFSSDDSYIVTTDGEDIKIFNVNSHTLIKTITLADPADIDKVYFSKDDEYIFYTTDDYDWSNSKLYIISNPLKYTQSISMSINADPDVSQRLGKEILITTEASVGDCVFKFAVNDGESQVFLNEYSAENTYAWKPAKVGDYKLIAYAKDKSSINEYDAFVVMDYTITSPISVSNVKADSAGLLRVGEEITFTAEASGGTELYYRYRIFDGESWETISSYSTESTCKWTPDKPGNYTVQLYVKDESSDRNYDVRNNTAIEVLPAEIHSNVELTEFKADTASPQDMGAEITFTANASGGEAIQYMFKIYDEGEWITVSDYSTDSSFVWSPAKPGVYDIAVYIKDKLSAKDFDDKEVIRYIIEPEEAAESVQIQSFYADIRQPHPVGTQATFIAEASGGTQLYYMFRINNGKEWKVLKDFSESNTLIWVPAVPGQYIIEVLVRDKNSKNRFDESERLDWSVGSKSIKDK